QQIGLTNFRALEQKRTFEEDYTAQGNKPEFKEYAGVLPKLKSLYEQVNSVNFEAQLFVEYMYYGPELFNFSYRFHDLVVNYDTLQAQGKLQATIEELKKGARTFYKDFDLSTEMEIYARLQPLYEQKYTIRGEADNVPYVSESDRISYYTKSVFSDSTMLFKLLDKPGKSMLKKMKGDYFYSHAQWMFDDYNTRVRPALGDFNKQIDFWMQKYTEGMMKMFPGNYWADANSTLRISYGKVEGSFPRDGEHYTPHTTADGILQKYYTGNPDFVIGSRLKSLLQARNYGDYGAGGELNVCYTGSNHTTGGNSGSPALNAKGELTGINFDRSWESTMSDIMYNPEICRNIMVDIRYVLWVIDVYAEVDYLLNEMTIVR
ncbi:MAG: S46 family peptidase, partial [Flavobacteriales bacterium]